MTDAPEWEYPKKIYVLPENAKSFDEQISAPRKCYTCEDLSTYDAGFAEGIKAALEAVRHTTLNDGPKWPEDRMGVWLAALTACENSILKISALDQPYKKPR